MALHRLTQIVIGVTSVEETAAYYADFGLTPRATASMAGAGRPGILDFFAGRSASTCRWSLSVTFRDPV